MPLLLHGPHARIATAVLEQLAVRAALDHPTTLHHQDFMGIDHRGQPVRNHQRGLVLGGAAQFGLYGPLVAGIQGRSGFVKNQNRRILQQGPSDGHPLLFAARELEATLTDHGLIPFWRGADEIVDARSPSRLFHLLAAGPGATVGDVVEHGVVEQHRVLRHDADGLPHAGLRHRADVLSGNQDAPASAAVADIVETKQQPGQRGLASPRGAHHRHGLASWNIKADPVQYRPRGIVGKVHVVKAHIHLTCG